MCNGWTMNAGTDGWMDGCVAVCIGDLPFWREGGSLHLSLSGKLRRTEQKPLRQQRQWRLECFWDTGLCLCAFGFGVSAFMCWGLGPSGTSSKPPQPQSAVSSILAHTPKPPASNPCSSTSWLDEYYHNDKNIFNT